MQRYFVSPAQWTEDTVTITGSDAHHLIRVMRAKPGTKIIVSNGQGNAAVACITKLEADEVVAVCESTLAQSGEPEIEVWIAQSLPKGDKLETVIQKCTELGAARIIPFISERTIVRYDDKKLPKKLERWHKIAKEAAEQAHRSIVPEVTAPMTWRQMLELAKPAKSMLLYEQARQGGIKDVLRRMRDAYVQGETKHPFLVITGPEGGFAETEVQEAEAAGCAITSLGRRILRTETAAMAALSCIMYELDEMEG